RPPRPRARAAPAAAALDAGSSLAGGPPAGRAASVRHHPVTAGPERYDWPVATNPDWHPLDREIEEMLAANPGLEEELDEMERLHERGDRKLAEHEEVWARLRRLGAPLAEDEPADDPQS